MNQLVSAYAEGHAAALQKFAATRGMREIRNAVASGTPQGMERANMLAKTPGVLNANNTMGSQIKNLGGGSEGLATMVAHPQHGIAVRKMFDPNAPGYSPELIARKQDLGSLPGAAAHFGDTKTMHNTPVHFNEYVPGQNVTRGQLTPEQQQATQRAMIATNRGLRQQGYVGRDIRDGNLRLTPSGEAKVIDYLPFQKDEATPNNVQRQPRQLVAQKHAPAHIRDAVVSEPKGNALFPGKPRQGFDPTVSSANPGQFNRYMFTGDVTTPKAPTPRPGGTSIMPPSQPGAVGPPGYGSMLGRQPQGLPPSAPTSITLPRVPTQTLGSVPPATPAPPPMSRHTGMSEFL